MPVWIKGLRNFVKLKVLRTFLTDSDGTMQLLGNLPNLAILKLQSGTFEVQVLRLDFQTDAFPSLVALELCCAQRHKRRFESVEFQAGGAPKLEEVLSFTYRGNAAIIKDGLFSGLASLPNLKRFEPNLP
ncbi:hypothetical protein U9M48_037734 [Paspalum notatum var. saurae]|uniref:Uncharacterized protein n=1 Tax=Paspalum notatum var. saurae TaxID=547442 RepID=A0AAQ3ULU8_PASNO